MKNKLKDMKEFFKGKGFLIFAAVCLLAVAGAVGAVYRSATNLVRDYVTSQITETQPVEAEKKDEPDPRLTTKKQEESTSALAEKTTEQTTEAQTETTEKEIQNSTYVYPVEGEIIKDYSETPVYDETMDDWRVHKGIDILCSNGSRVVSVGNGRVTRVYLDSSFGYCVEIDHGDFTAKYCGLEQGTAVEIDAEVKMNDVVGTMGEIACESKQQEHFHFEILKEGKNIDPVEALR